jgi:transcription antitermination factor NusG
MQKNWYLIYTKAKCEKKVASIFTKKRIESFIPMNSKQITSGRKRKIIHSPLFESYFFANIEENEIRKIKMIDGVLNVVYWKQHPAIIQKEEIEVIRDFTSVHQNIMIEKTKVNVNDAIKVIDGPRYSIEGNILTVTNISFKVNLPSIGYALVARIETENPLQTEVSFGKKDLLLQ